MKIKLIDIDSKIPNLALMQLSAWHKQNGDTVGFDIENPDRVYISCVFEKNAEQARGLSTFYPDAEIIFGGSGLDLNAKIPEPAQKIKPDYSLYPGLNYDIGFTTRGCIRRCPFCVVPKKEGRIHRWNHISDFHDDGHKEVLLLDNNIYAEKEWFFENTNYLIEKNLRVNICQGMDIRILTEEIAEQLARLKFVNNLIHFAWDNIADEEKIFAGLETLKNAGINLGTTRFYILSGFNTTIEEDIYRCEKLRTAGALVYLMKYKSTPENKRLAWWANSPAAFRAMPYHEYDYRKRQRMKRKHIENTNT